VKPRDRSLLLAAGGALLIGGLVLWDRGRPTTDDNSRARAELVPGFDRAAASELEIVRGDHTTRLRHEAGGWYTVAPRRRADDAAVEGLLAALQYGRIERRLGATDAATRHKLGLDQPRVIVRAAGHTLRLGHDAPARGLYVERDPEREPLVAEHRLIETADLDPSLWRSPQLTVVDPAAAARIAFGDWTVERHAGWRMVRPAVARGADAKIDGLVQSLARARARRSLDDDATAAAAAGQGRALVLDDTIQARVAGPCPGAPAETLVARADGAVLCFLSTELNLLRAPPVTFYERRLVPLRLDDVVAVDVGPLSLRRAEGRWRITAPAGASGAARDEAVRTWLAPLLAAEARAFATAAPGPGAVRIRLATRDDALVVTVAGNLARRDGETVTLDLGTPLVLSTDPLPLSEK
jgi:hypothetical protein